MKCKTCDPCKKKLEGLRKKCSSLGIEAECEDRNFWFFCFAVRAAGGLSHRLEVMEWLACRPIPQKKKKKPAVYVVSRFPVPAVQKRFLKLAETNFPEVFEKQPPEEALKKIEASGRDEKAAAFLYRYLGIEAPLPVDFSEKCFRMQFEIITLEHLLRTKESKNMEEEIKKAVKTRDRIISRYIKKLEKSSLAVAQKKSEADRYREIAEKTAERLRQVESYYQDEVKKLHRKIRVLERINRRLKEELSGSTKKFDFRVLIVGDPKRKDAYRRHLEKKGIEVRFIDGIDKTCDPSVVKSVDLVVVAADYGRHSVLEKIKPLAKNYGVPYITVSSGGVSTVVSVVEERLFGQICAEKVG
ncbi:MAG TPA: hypothetical protein DEA47_01110 [Peptococcaceae bacterium]|nr:MAG: hypothetical protein XD50_0267 [Clostridia bacterium 41_269]HBT19963.1 hypothetical protein [Peptococcaceae bacterium]